MLLDVDYILLGLPGVLTAVWAWRTSSRARARASRTPSSAGLTGAEAARLVMESAGIEPVPIEVAEGPLADHYEAGRRRLRLSAPVCFGRSLAAVGTASHEAAHAVQEAQGSRWTPLRRGLVPLADLGSILAWLLLLAGVGLGLFRLTVWGLAAFSVAVLLQLLNLGPELDASRRAMRALQAAGKVDAAERSTLARAQAAAAWSHVAGVLTGLPAFLAAGLAPLAHRLRHRG